MGGFLFGVAFAAVAAATGVGGAEGAVAGVAVLERDGEDPVAGRGEVRCTGERGWQERGDPVAEEPGRMLQGAGEVGGEGVADGVGVGVAFEPGGDAGGKGGDIPFGEREPGCVAAEVGEERGGRALKLGRELLRLGERRRRWCGARGGSGFRLRRGRRRGRCGGRGRGRGGSWDGGAVRVRLRARAGVRLPVGWGWGWGCGCGRRWGCGRGLWDRLAGSVPGARGRGGLSGGTWLVVGDGAGDDAAVGEAYAAAVEVAVGFEFAQGGGDAELALGEAFGEALDADPGSGGERLDVGGEPDRGEGEAAVLGEVVADDGVARGMPEVDVDDAS